MPRHRMIFSLAAALAMLVGIAAVEPAAAQQPQDRTTVPVPVTATTAAGTHVDGTLHIRRFSARDNMVYAVGILNADVPGTGRIADEPVRVTVQRIESSCNPAAFRVVLGPLSVDAADTDAALSTATSVDLRELAIGVTADGGDQFLSTMLCGVNNVMMAMLGGATLDLTGTNLPVPAPDVARLLNRAIRLVA